MGRALHIETCEIEGCEVQFETKQGRFCPDHYTQIRSDIASRNNKLRPEKMIPTNYLTPKDKESFISAALCQSINFKPSDKQIITGMFGA